MYLQRRSSFKSGCQSYSRHSLLSCLALVIFSRSLITPTLTTPTGEELVYSRASQPGYDMPQWDTRSTGVTDETGHEFDLPVDHSHASITNTLATPVTDILGAKSSEPLENNLGQFAANDLKRVSAPKPPRVHSDGTGYVTGKFPKSHASIANRLSPPPSPGPLDNTARQLAVRSSSIRQGEGRKPLPALPELPD